MKEMQLYDIYGHWHVPFWQTTIFKITASIILFLLIVGPLAWYIITRMRYKKLPPHEVALRALEKLKKRPIETRKDAAASYYQLTDIVKDFFGQHYKLPVKGMSDTQMMAALFKTTLPHSLLAPLQTMVEASAYVKYAQQDALRAQVLHHIEMGQSVIQTIIKP